MKKIVSLLTLTTAFFVFSGCSSTNNLNMLSALTGKSWNLNSLMGSPLNKGNFPMGIPNLNFGDGGKITGSTGCNNFNGTFRMDKGGAALDPGAMTRKFCEGSGENDFIGAMKQVNKLKMDGNMLKMMNGSKELMSFIPKN